MLALDDSLSMNEQEVGSIALKSLSILGLAINKLEITKLIIGKITNTFEILHGFEENFNLEKCKEVISKFSFQY